VIYLSLRRVNVDSVGQRLGRGGRFPRQGGGV